jgi:ApbE superfamily uncharacterized protein (UPF0280 family)
MKTVLYVPKTYRTMCQTENLVNGHVMIQESDLLIRAERDLRKPALHILAFLRQQIKDYIDFDISFQNALAPIEIADWAPDIIRKMAAAADVFKVGPMAAVAGAISEEMVHCLSDYSETVIVENGGDVFLKNQQALKLAIYNHNAENITLEIAPHVQGIAVCTSSGKFGHSLSFGRADSITVIAPSAYHADAAATAFGNIVQSSDDIQQAIDIAKHYKTITGLVISIGNKVGFFGKEVKLV